MPGSRRPEYVTPLPELAHELDLLAQAERKRWTPYVVADFDGLLSAVKLLDPNKTLIVVTNEVGLGIVPAYPLGRLYRDTLGYVNQRLAQAADRVYLMVAGMAVDIKRLHEEASL